MLIYLKNDYLVFITNFLNYVDIVNFGITCKTLLKIFENNLIMKTLANSWISSNFDINNAIRHAFVIKNFKLIDYIFMTNFIPNKLFNNVLYKNEFNFESKLFFFEKILQNEKCIADFNLIKSSLDQLLLENNLKKENKDETIFNFFKQIIANQRINNVFKKKLVKKINYKNFNISDYIIWTHENSNIFDFNDLISFSFLSIDLIQYLIGKYEIDDPQYLNIMIKCFHLNKYHTLEYMVNQKRGADIIKNNNHELSELLHLQNNNLECCNIIISNKYYYPTNIINNYLLEIFEKELKYEYENNIILKLLDFDNILPNECMKKKLILKICDEIDTFDKEFLLIIFTHPKIIDQNTSELIHREIMINCLKRNDLNVLILNLLKKISVDLITNDIIISLSENIYLVYKLIKDGTQKDLEIFLASSKDTFEVPKIK